MRRLIFIAPVILAALALTGCGGGTSSDQPAANATAPAATGWNDQSPTSVIPVVLQFGQAYTWSTGDIITVGAPVRHTDFISVPVSIHNGGDAPMAVGAIDSPIMFNTNVNNTDLAPTALSDPAFKRPSGFIGAGQTLRYQEVYEFSTASPVKVQVIASGTMGDPKRPAVVFEGVI